MTQPDGGATSHQGATAIVLAGGASTRFRDSPSSPNKLDAAWGDHSLLAETLSHIPAGWCALVIGPDRSASAPLPNGHQGEFLQEPQPLAGPAAALAFAIRHVKTPLTFVLAGDTPHGGLCGELLINTLAANDDADGVQALDSSNRPQPLLAIYRTLSLTQICSTDVASGTPMRKLLSPLHLRYVSVPPDHCAGVNTPDELEACRTAIRSK